MFGLSNLKLIAIAVGLAVAIGLPTWAAWKLGKGSGREEVREEAQREIAEVRRDAQEKMALQQQLTKGYQELADENYGKLLSKLTDLKITHTTVTQKIVEERAANPVFYEQPLPPGGLQQWEKSRQLLQ